MTAMTGVKIIVPLAGPDFELPDGRTRAEIEIDGRPLLRRALETRPWRGPSLNGADHVFVLRDTERSRAFADGRIANWYPAAGCVFLGAPTAGAALSALAGVALVAGAEEVLCVDLADILYDTAFDPMALRKDPTAGAAVLVFPASGPIYSYVRLGADGRIDEAVEKRPISQLASAGTYFFANPAIYLRAVAHGLRHRDMVTFNSLFYVCPLINGVVAEGSRPLAVPVSNVRDIKRT
jgi:hypothetical protein